MTPQSQARQLDVMFRILIQRSYGSEFGFGIRIRIQGLKKRPKILNNHNIILLFNDFYNTLTMFQLTSFDEIRIQWIWIRKTCWMDTAESSSAHRLYITLKIIFFPTPPLSEIIFFPLTYLYLQERKNKHIFDNFVLVFEQIVFINFHCLSPSALSTIFPPIQYRYWVKVCEVQVQVGPYSGSPKNAKYSFRMNKLKNLVPLTTNITLASLTTPVSLGARSVESA